MANLDFYAVADDLRSLISYLFRETDIVIYEMSSRHNLPARQFCSLRSLEDVFVLGTYRAAYLQLWSPSVMKEPAIRRIEMTGLPGKPHRENVEGAGLMQLYLNGAQDGVIHHTHFGHWNEAGARQRSIHPADNCNWRELTKLSGRIQRQIGGKLACAKLYSRPVLRHAYASIRDGSSLGFGPDLHDASSPCVVATVA